MLKRVADWHGEQAAKSYVQYMRTNLESDLDAFHRHLVIAERLWRGK